MVERVGHYLLVALLLARAKGMAQVVRALGISYAQKRHLIRLRPGGAPPAFSPVQRGLV